MCSCSDRRQEAPGLRIGLDYVRDVVMGVMDVTLEFLVHGRMIAHGGNSLASNHARRPRVEVKRRYPPSQGCWSIRWTSQVIAEI